MKTVNNQSENLRDFVKKQNFLLIIDSVANGNSMLRGLNRGIEDLENIDIVNGKTLNLDRIAEELVMAYAAFYEPEKHYQVIDFQVGTASIYRLIKAGNLSFVPCESWNLDTAGEILRVLDQLRMNQMKQDKISAGGLKIGELVLLQKKYEDGLRAEGKMDLPMLLEQAISVLKEIEGGGKKDIGYLLPYMELDVGVLPNPEWSLKEQEFLELLERVSGRSFTHLFVQAQNAAAPKYHFFKGYGVVNEVRYVVEKILGESICYGDVALIYGAPNYENVIRSVFENERIPYYFQKGLHALTDDHVKLLYDCIQFAREDYSYKVLRKVVYNPVFHIKKKEDGKKKRYKAKRGYSRVLKQGIGWGRQRYLDFFEWYDKWYNGTYVEFSQEEREKEEDVRLFVEFLKELIEVFDKERCDEIFAALLKLMHKYTITYMVGRVKDSEEGPINLYSQAIHPQLKQQCQAFALLDKGSDDYLLLYQQYLKQLTIGMPDDAGAVELVPYGSRKYFDRKYLFVVGLANETVEKTQTESPVLSDVELKSCVDGVIDVAAERNKRNRERFEDTLKWFPGNDIYLGFSVFDEVKLLENTPASIYMELLKRAETAEEEVEIIGYDISMVNTEKLTKERFYEEFEELIRRRQEEEKVEKANEESQMHGTNEADEVNWFDEEDLESLDDEDDWDDEEDEEDWDDEEGEEDWDDEEDEEDWDDEEGEEDWDDEDDWDDEEDEDDVEDKAARQVELSATSLQTLLQCPMKYHYQRHKHLYIDEQQERNGHSWLTPIEKGNLFHHSMENYCKSALIDEEKDKLDETLLKKCFDEQIDERKRLQPYPSEAVFEEEREEAWEVLKQYVEVLHEKLNSVNKEDGKQYKVLGCEVEFKDLVRYIAGSGAEADLSEFDDIPEAKKYIDDLKKKCGCMDSVCKVKIPLKLVFNGSIDRVDGEVNSDNSLKLYIIDYKTGKRENKQSEIKKEKQIQHFIYMAAAIKWAKENLSTLNTRFDRTIDKDKISIEAVQYDFPYDSAKSNIGIKIGDFGAYLKEERVYLPKSTKECLKKTEGLYQHGYEFLAETYACNVSGKEDGKDGKEDDSKLCQYCVYADICRAQLKSGGKG